MKISDLYKERGGKEMIYFATVIYCVGLAVMGIGLGWYAPNSNFYLRVIVAAFWPLLTVWSGLGWVYRRLFWKYRIVLIGGVYFVQNRKGEVLAKLSDQQSAINYVKAIKTIYKG